jgi:hypothetical protein
MSMSEMLREIKSGHTVLIGGEALIEMAADRIESLTTDLTAAREEVRVLREAIAELKPKFGKIAGIAVVKLIDGGWAIPVCLLPKFTAVALPQEEPNNENT